jgi:GcrA cell cycle regulator
MRAADPWSRERVAMLEKLWAEGATAQSIAGRLGGVSRSAVLGKIFRLRLEAGAPAPTAALSANQIIQRTDATPADPTAPVRRRGGKRDASRERQIPPRTRGKSLIELGNASCRWPLGSNGRRAGRRRWAFNRLSPQPSPASGRGARSASCAG